MFTVSICGHIRIATNSMLQKAAPYIFNAMDEMMVRFHGINDIKILTVLFARHDRMKEKVLQSQQLPICQCQQNVFSIFFGRSPPSMLGFSTHLLIYSCFISCFLGVSIDENSNEFQIYKSISIRRIFLVPKN